MKLLFFHSSGLESAQILDAKLNVNSSTVRL
jgi:hypothetical protein